MNQVVPDVSSLTPRLSPDIDGFCVGDEKTVTLTNTSLNVENSTVHIGNVIHHHHHVPVSLCDAQEEETHTSQDNEFGPEKSYTPEETATKYVILRDKKICSAISTIFVVTLVAGVVLLLYFTQIPNTTSKETSPEKSNDDDEDSDAKPSHTFGNLTHLSGCKIFEEEEWGIKRNLGDIVLIHPVPHIIISHSATPFCNTTKKCKTRMSSMQEYHISTGSPDIGYNFMIGGDGNIYVGRGWNARNFHLGNHSIGINFVGNYFRDELTPKMIDCAQKVIAYGKESKILKADYKVLCHNQTNPKMVSPGPNVYAIVKNWPNFMPGSVSRNFLYEV